jgi:hypothetical protein
MNIWACYLLLVVQNHLGSFPAIAAVAGLGRAVRCFPPRPTPFTTRPFREGPIPLYFSLACGRIFLRPTWQHHDAAVLIPASSPSSPTKLVRQPRTTAHSSALPPQIEAEEERERGSPKTLTPPIPPPEIGILRCRRRHGSDERPGEDVLLRARVQ